MRQRLRNTLLGRTKVAPLCLYPGPSASTNQQTSGQDEEPQSSPLLFGHAKVETTGHTALTKAAGGLSNNFTHKLALVLNILDGDIDAVMGETRNDMLRAPLVSGVHDFRTRADVAPATIDDVAEWAAVDSEWSYTVMARLASPHASQGFVSALFKHGGLHPPFNDDYVAVYGSEGTIVIKGAYAVGPLFFRPRGGSWKELAVPAHIEATLPQIADPTQRNWTQLAREFVADIAGEAENLGYLTFHDGWRFQEVVDAVRRSQGWTEIPK